MRKGLRGAGIWALGYDGTRPELYAMLKAKFITDKVPPVISAASVSAPFVSANGDGRMDTVTVRATVTGHLKFGWSVAPLAAGVAGPAFRSGSANGKAVAYTWDGRDGAAGKLVPDGTYRITLWTADASDNRASVARDVTVDRRASVVALAMHPGFLSPDGDGKTDTAALVMRADEAITGSARIIRSGKTIRRWTLTAATRKDWTWNGRDADGRIVARRSLHAPGQRRRPGRQPDGPRHDGAGRPHHPVRDLGALLVRAAVRCQGSVHGRPAPAGEGDRGDLPRVDAGPEDLDRAQPPDRLARLDVERQDRRREVRRARPLQGRGRCDELDRHVALHPRRHGQGAVAAAPATRLDAA